MTIMEGLEKAKRLQRERISRESGLEHKQPRSPTDTGTLRILHDGARAESEPVPITELARVDIDPVACERSRVLFTEEQLVAEGGGAAAYRLLRSRILHRARSGNWSCIGISSPGPGEGKSVTIINLAISIAREKLRPVYLLDLDMRSPTVMSNLGVNPPQALPRFFAGELTASEVLFATNIDSLMIAGATEPVARASEMLATSDLDELLLQIRRRSPDALILMDLPPGLSTDEALVVAPRTDALFLVVSEGKTRRDGLERVLSLLNDFNVAGIILNRSYEKVGRGYYGY